MIGHAATDHANVVLLVVGYPPSVMFVLAYGLSQPWWRSWLGRGLLLMTTSLSALLGANLLYRLYEWDLLAREGWLRTAIYGFICTSMWFVLLAFLVPYLRWRRRR